MNLRRKWTGRCSQPAIIIRYIFQCTVLLTYVDRKKAWTSLYQRQQLGLSYILQSFALYKCQSVGKVWSSSSATVGGICPLDQQAVFCAHSRRSSKGKNMFQGICMVCGIVYVYHILLLSCYRREQARACAHAPIDAPQYFLAVAWMLPSPRKKMYRIVSENIFIFGHFNVQQSSLEHASKTCFASVSNNWKYVYVVVVHVTLIADFFGIGFFATLL